MKLIPAIVTGWPCVPQTMCCRSAAQCDGVWRRSASDAATGQSPGGRALGQEAAQEPEEGWGRRPRPGSCRNRRLRLAVTVYFSLKYLKCLSCYNWAHWPPSATLGPGFLAARLNDEAPPLHPVIETIEFTDCRSSSLALIFPNTYLFLSNVIT